MAEVHITGQLLGASGFPLPSIFCKWSFESGSNFRVLQGQVSGQTQCDTPCEGEPAVLTHPLDARLDVLRREVDRLGRRRAAQREELGPPERVERVAQARDRAQADHELGAHGALEDAPVTRGGGASWWSL